MKDNMPNIIPSILSITDSPLVVDSITGELINAVALGRRNDMLEHLAKTRRNIKCHTGELYAGNYVKCFDYDFEVSIRTSTRGGYSRKNGGIKVTKIAEFNQYKIEAILYGSPVAEIIVEGSSKYATLFNVWIPSRTTITFLHEVAVFLHNMAIQFLLPDGKGFYTNDFITYSDFKAKAIADGNYNPTSGIGRY